MWKAQSVIIVIVFEKIMSSIASSGHFINDFNKILNIQVQSVKLYLYMNMSQENFGKSERFPLLQSLIFIDPFSSAAYR